jgi:hypothetical protein
LKIDLLTFLVLIQRAENSIYGSIPRSTKQQGDGIIAMVVGVCTSVRSNRSIFVYLDNHINATEICSFLSDFLLFFLLLFSFLPFAAALPGSPW